MKLASDNETLAENKALILYLLNKVNKPLENTAFSRVFCYLARSERTSKNPIFKVSGHTHPTVFGKTLRFINYF